MRKIGAKTVLVGAAVWIFSLLAGIGVLAQSAGPRNLEELKAETQKRVDRNVAPAGGLKSEDAREALTNIHSLDRDEWAAAWSAIADRYANRAITEESSDKVKAQQDYLLAWRYYSFARWPVPNSPGKQKAYEKALEAYWAYAKKYDPPLETVRVPYEGSEVVGYLRMPKKDGKSDAQSVPFVIAIAGLDSRKEEM